MIIIKILLALSEGLVFGILALGIYTSFQWLRYPDLTPDGSFALGATTYVKLTIAGVPPWLSLGAALIAGTAAGILTAGINRFVRIPTVVAGLLVASALYSSNWLLLGRPNQYLEPSGTLVGDLPARVGIWRLLGWLGLVSVLAIVMLTLFSQSMWGIRLRAIGENALLARDLGTTETRYTFLGLAVANALVGLSGALFVQRSFSADINMGIGMTITGLAGMILGLLICHKRRKVIFALISVCIGSILYKLVIFIALELGVPAESFRLLSAVILIATFLILHSSQSTLLRGLKWS